MELKQCGPDEGSSCLTKMSIKVVFQVLSAVVQGSTEAAKRLWVASILVYALWHPD